MDTKDSSDEEEAHISAFTKFDESIEVRNAEEIQSPVNHRPSSSKRPRPTRRTESRDVMGINSPREKLDFRRYYLPNSSAILFNCYHCIFFKGTLTMRIALESPWESIVIHLTAKKAMMMI